MPKKAKRRPARKRPAKSPAVRSTELARRIPPAGVDPGRWRSKVDEAVADYRRVGDDLMLGELGLAEIKFTKAEEKVLSEPVPLLEVRIKPTGQPYIPHPGYTRWFNRAFGRGGWNLVPVSKPMRSGSSVVCPYVLFIHGKPAAFAMGEQEYFENNRDQTYGDALESTVASALRRCSKRLGVGLELWDRPWLDNYVRTECVRVRVKNRDNTESWAWRRRDDHRLPREQSGRDDGDAEYIRPAQREEAPRPGRQQQQTPRSQPAPRADANEPITGPQAKRLDTITINSGRGDQEVDEWLLRRFAYKNRAAVQRKDYDYIVRCIEAEGALPEGKHR